MKITRISDQREKEIQRHVNILRAFEEYDERDISREDFAMLLLVRNDLQALGVLDTTIPKLLALIGPLRAELIPEVAQRAYGKEAQRSLRASP